MDFSKIKNSFFTKFKNLGLSFKALLIAPILILAAIGLVYFSESFDRSSKIVEKLDLEKAIEMTDSEGTHKIQGSPIIKEPAKAPNVGDTLYYTYVVEEYAQVEEKKEETTTETVNGETKTTTTEKTELVDKWTEVSTTQDHWATFKLGDITIIPNSASKKLDYTVEEYWVDEFGDYMRFETEDDATPILGDQRMFVTYLNIDTDLIVIGDVSEDSEGNKSIKSGETFIITNKTDSELISNMQASENATYWFVKIIALVLLVIGFKGLVAPLLALTDFIPLVGKAANSVATGVAVVLAVIVITIVSLVVKFWWVLLLGIVVTIYMIYIQGSKPSERTRESTEKEYQEKQNK